MATDYIKMRAGECFVESVRIGHRLRSIDPEKVAALAESIDAIGLRQPISVWAPDLDTLDLVAGLHRLEAFKLLRRQLPDEADLRWDEIPCIFVDMDDLDRQLWEIDENLIRSDLTDLQRAQHTAKRAEVIRQKVVLAKSAKTKTDRSKNADKGQGDFVADTAKKTGRSKRSVGADKARGEKIAPDVQKDIEGTAIADSGVQLDALAAATPWDQREAVKAVNLGDAKDVREVLPEAKGKRAKSRRTKEEIDLVEFDRVIRFFSTACGAIPKINVPNLDSKRRSQAIADLRNARKHIEELIQIVQNARDEDPAP